MQNMSYCSYGFSIHLRISVRGYFFKVFFFFNFSPFVILWQILYTLDSFQSEVLWDDAVDFGQLENAAIWLTYPASGPTDSVSFKLEGESWSSLINIKNTFYLKGRARGGGKEREIKKEWIFHLYIFSPKTLMPELGQAGSQELLFGLHYGW